MKKSFRCEHCRYLFVEIHDCPQGMVFRDLINTSKHFLDTRLLPGNDVCRHAVRTERSYWLVNENIEDPALKPMTDIDEILPYISRCAVSFQTEGYLEILN